MALAKMHPHERDARIEFREAEHIYILDGHYVFPRSVSRLVAQNFDEFQGFATARKCLAKWRADPRGKYFSLIKAAEAELPKNTNIAAFINAAWGANGAHKSELGRMMHLTIEHALNGTTPPNSSGESDGVALVESAQLAAPRVFEALIAPEMGPLRREEAAFVIDAALKGSLRADARPRVVLPPAAADSTEMRAWRRWSATAGASLAPIRTEWSIFSTQHDIAGQIDALFRCRASGKFVLVDWKRVNPMPKEANALYPRRGKPPVDHLPDTKYWHYAIQVNVYAYLLGQFYKVPVSEMRLVQIHPDLPDPGFVEHPVALMAPELLAALLGKK